MAILKWDPFAELNALHEQVNSLFSDNLMSSQVPAKVMPPTDVYSDDNHLIIEAHLPGFTDEEISIDQQDGALEIRAEHHEKDEDKGRKYMLRESASRYYRRIGIPKNIDTDKIEASFEHGVLTVKAPYKELPKPKRIALKSKKN